MGARPEQQLALNFLSAVHDLWVKYPGTYVVKESLDDLVPALAQMCIKALAADVRDGIPPADQYRTSVDGELLNHGQVLKGGHADQQLTLRDVVNKIIHGTPAITEVSNRAVLPHFTNSAAGDWTAAWFSGTDLLRILDRLLYKHHTTQAAQREQKIADLLRALGEEGFLPMPRANNGRNL